MTRASESKMITVNGKSLPYTGQTVLDVIREIGIDPERAGIAVAVNDTVIPRAKWAETVLQPGDRVEVVRAVAGG